MLHANGDEALETLGQAAERLLAELDNRKARETGRKPVKTGMNQPKNAAEQEAGSNVIPFPIHRIKWDW